jgi:hypothetical protein
VPNGALKFVVGSGRDKKVRPDRRRAEEKKEERE